MFSLLAKKIKFNKSTAVKIFVASFILFFLCFFSVGITKATAQTTNDNNAQLLQIVKDFNSKYKGRYEYTNTDLSTYNSVKNKGGNITDEELNQIKAEYSSILEKDTGLTPKSEQTYSYTDEKTGAVTTVNADGVVGKTVVKKTDGSYTVGFNDGKQYWYDKDGNDITKEVDAGAAAPQFQTSTQDKDLTCSIWSDNTINCFVAKIAYYILQVISALVYGAGTLLDLAFKLTVLQMKNTIDLVKDPIQQAWTSIRDIINITFIFALLYAAIGTILRLSTVDTKKMVSSVIIAAVFINFSLFFTQVIIDFSNNFTVTIWNSIQGTKSSIAAGVMDSLKLHESFITPEAVENSNLFISIITRAFFTGILLLVIAWVFAIIAILLVVRFLTFIMLMITSPVAIGGGVFPKLKETLGGDWRKSLFDQCTWAPVFFLLFSIALNLNSKLITLASSSGATGVTLGNTDKQSLPYTLLSSIIVIGLIITAFIYSKKISASGAGAIHSYAVKYGSAAVSGVTLGLAARGMRRAGGALGERIATSNRLQANPNDGKFKSWLKQSTLKGAKGMNETSFDVRNTTLGGNLGLGKGIDKGGMSKVMKDAQKVALDQDKWLAGLETKEQKAARKEAEDATRKNAADKYNLDLAQANAHLKNFEANKGSDEIEGKLEAAKKELEVAKKLSTNPTMSEPGRKLAEEKAANKEKEVSDLEKQKKSELNENLTKAFKQINVDVNPENKLSVDAAKKQADYLTTKKAQNDTDGTGSHKFSDLNGKELKELEKIAREQLKVSQASEHELKNVKTNIEGQQKLTRIQYAQTLKDKRFGFVGPKLKENASAASSVEKEVHKSGDAKQKEKMAKEVMKYFKEAGAVPETETAPKTEEKVNK